MPTDCPKCDGYGILDGEHEPETCDHCGGSGHAPRAQYLSPPPTTAGPSPEGDTRPMTDTLHPMAESLRSSLYEATDAMLGIEGAERGLKLAEARVACDVLEATNGDGKPLYSNETARKVAIEAAQAIDEDCGAYRASVAEHRRARAYAEADAEALRYTMRLAIGARD